ncbi:MAG TPA: DUF2442 domain-containing protein [Pirellulales bacterium]|jgi:hypothetical protein|nr:DUF2442 domain-containing protein [Pirellulales bacterium]
MQTILRIVEARVSGPHALQLRFNNGAVKEVDLARELDGPIFEPLREPSYFALGTLDPVCGTVIWPNGADFAPEALFEMASGKQKTST